MKAEGRSLIVRMGMRDPNRTLQPLEDGELNPKRMKDEGNKLPSALCPDAKLIL
ncbi:MAG: hypothetical protein QNJ55_26880 [Xenococcus sp. MO_188.B8]|nr:hypothetical protein [Xenococcus sp. MO_188.B8]